MSKKSQMQEEVERTEGEQMDLIDVAPENAKEIIKHARTYRAAQKQRLSALEEEVTQKNKLLELIKAANLQRMADGKIKCRCDGFTITVTPRDEKVTIKEESEE